MAGKNTSVFGIYSDRAELEQAVDRLRSAGFRSTDISGLLPENAGTKDFAHEKHTKAPEGAVAGASTGAVIGAALGRLAGIGALAGALIGIGIPEYEAKRYEGRIRNGGILLSVHCDKSDWIKRARQTLVETGAADVSTTSEAKADFAASEKPQPRIHNGDSLLKR